MLVAGTVWQGSWSSEMHNSTTSSSSSTSTLSAPSQSCNSPSPDKGTSSHPSKIVSSSSVTNLERVVKVFKLENMEIEEEFEAVNNRIKLLRINGNQIAIADNLHGVRIFCTETLKLLYEIEVDEIRNIVLVGDYLAVFHKFESNVSLWNAQEKKTILCLNIQDQVKELLEDDDAEILLEEDTETCVINVPYEDSGLLIYATKTGNVFGMIVNSRNKVCSIPSPFNEEQDQVRELEGGGEKYGLKSLCYVHPGLIVLVSKVTIVLDFNNSKK